MTDEEIEELVDLREEVTELQSELAVILESRDDWKARYEDLYEDMDQIDTIARRVIR